MDPHDPRMAAIRLVRAQIERNDAKRLDLAALMLDLEHEAERLAARLTELNANVEDTQA